MAALPSIPLLQTAPGRLPVITAIKVKQVGFRPELVSMLVTPKCDSKA